MISISNLMAFSVLGWACGLGGPCIWCLGGDLGGPCCLGGDLGGPCCLGDGGRCQSECDGGGD